jgi:hypothetical protein
VSVKQAASKGTTKKHAGTTKHAAAKKHAPTAKKKTATTTHKTAKATAVAKAPAAAKPRALSPGDVSCCSAEALAWSLRLAGWPVDGADVLALYRLTADSPDAGASILATLDAAYVFGLAGIRPVSFEAVADLDDPRSLLLGVDLPGRHTVLSSGGWISWGRWHHPDDFPDAVIEEAWAVTWP